MFKIENNIIKLTKGDSAIIDVTLKNPDGSTYTMKTGDKLTFTVRKKPTSTILMQVESTTTKIQLPPNKTSQLEAGSCCYDIQLNTGSDIYTVAGLTDNVATNMIVYSEVTY